jgi:hypothetical protein
MGVGRPEDFVTILNRFPVHCQSLTNAIQRGLSPVLIEINR